MGDDYDAHFDIYAAWPEGSKAWTRLSASVLASGLDVALLNLVMIRASQLNRCSFCLDMHSREALDAGEDPRRLNTVAAWRDTAWFNDVERASLALTETITQMSRGDVDDAVIDDARSLLGDEALAKLVMAVVVINGWNRLNVAAHLTPGR